MTKRIGSRDAWDGPLTTLFVSIALVVNVGCGQEPAGNPSVQAGNGGETAGSAGGAVAGGAAAGGAAAGGAGRNGGSGGAGTSTGGTASPTGNNTEIPVRYVVLASADRTSWERTFPSWTDCTDPAVDELQEARCMPGATLARFNQDFEQLASARPFRRASFEVVERSAFARLLTQQSPLDTCGVGLVTSPDGSKMVPDEFTRPGTLTVIVVEEIVGAVAGYAGVGQGLNASHGAWLVVEAPAPLFAFEHELGHAFGLQHFLLSPQDYPYCGGMRWDSAEQPGCVCEFNVMGMYASTAVPNCSCNFGTSPVAKFDTPRAADFVRHVARCWLNERRYAQECLVESDAGAGICTGEEGDVRCYCPDAQSTFTTQSCSDAAAAQRRADLVEHCPIDCTVRTGRSYYSCHGSPFEVTCQCSENGPTFNVPGCSDEYAELRDARAKATCGVAHCSSQKVPGVVCEGLATLDTIGCTCPNGTQFDTPTDCHLLDMFVESLCATGP
jgi:hypothetical protein